MTQEKDFGKSRSVFIYQYHGLYMIHRIQTHWLASRMLHKGLAALVVGSVGVALEYLNADQYMKIVIAALRMQRQL